MQKPRRRKKKANRLLQIFLISIMMIGLGYGFAFFGEKYLASRQPARAQEDQREEPIWTRLKTRLLDQDVPSDETKQPQIEMTDVSTSTKDKTAPLERERKGFSKKETQILNSVLDKNLKP